MSKVLQARVGSANLKIRGGTLRRGRVTAFKDFSLEYILPGSPEQNFKIGNLQALWTEGPTPHRYDLSAAQGAIWSTLKESAGTENRIFRQANGDKILLPGSHIVPQWNRCLARNLLAEEIVRNAETILTVNYAPETEPAFESE